MEFVILVPLGVMGLVGLMIYKSYLAEKQRTADLQQLARELGFEFFPHGHDDLRQELGRFHLFSLGRSQVMRNLLRGRSHDLEVAVFDYQYVTGRGKSRRTWQHWVICFQFDQPHLPVFALRPETVWHKVGSWFGYQDFDFESHPGFSSSYLLRGNHESAVRGLFTEPVLEWFERHRGLSTEGADQRLLFYREHDRVEPAKVRALLEEGFQVLKLFRPGEG